MSHRPPENRRTARSSPLIGALIAGPLLVVALAVWTSAFPTEPTEPCTLPVSCHERLELSGGGTVSYFRSLSLIRNDRVTRAVLIVHGNRRDADRYFAHGVAAAAEEGRLHDAIILAPSFRTIDDDPDPREHHWSSHGWKVGNRSRDPRRISSFEVMDDLLDRVCGSGSSIFPQLRTVAIIGHSAGGQFVNRYVAGGAACSNPEIETRFVVMNPSSYLYLDAQRRSATTGKFELPKTDCDRYDEYKYGLLDLNAYMRHVGIERLRENLFTRKTYYLAGSEDTRSGKSLDKGCEAMLQGRNRLRRHENYERHAGRFAGWQGSVFMEVPGLGHDGGGMIRSESAREIIFR